MPLAARVALVLALVLVAAIAACDLAFPIHDDPVDAGSEASAETGVEGGDAGGGDAASMREASCSYQGGALGSYTAEVLKDGPAMYLRLDESAGPVAHDQTKHIDGTYADGGLAFGVAGAILGDPDTAVSFDGGSIAMPPSFDFAGRQPFTLEAWASLAPGNGYGWVFDHSYWGDDAGIRVSWNFYLNDGATAGMTFERRQSDGTTAGSVVGSGTPFPLGSYHYAVATFDGTNLTLYFDGNQVAFTGTGGTDLPTTGSGWTIASQNCGCSDHFLGVLDELAVYPVALTADRVCAHYLASGRP